MEIVFYSYIKKLEIKYGILYFHKPQTTNQRTVVLPHDATQVFRFLYLQ